MTENMMDEIIQQLTTISADSDFYMNINDITLNIHDFGGFDENWHELEREYTRPEAVKAVLQWLAKNADSYEEDLYTHYHFGDFTVTVGYDSFNI